MHFFAMIYGSVNGKYLITSFTKDDKKPIVCDILVTSGNAGIYPKDILVGKVVKVTDEQVFVIPFVNINNLDYVQVIQNN